MLLKTDVNKLKFMGRRSQVVYGAAIERKNRKPNWETGSSCIGTDVNRNFAYKWMVSGSSNYPCSG